MERFEDSISMEDKAMTRKLGPEMYKRVLKEHGVNWDKVEKALGLKIPDCLKPILSRLV